VTTDPDVRNQREEEPVTAEPHLDTLPAEVFDKLRRVSTSTLATQLYKRGFRQPSLVGVRPLSQVVDGFAGEAFTMRFIPAREDVNTLDPYRSGNTLQWESIENVPPGHVIVVDSRGDASAASGGDMLMTRAMVRGAAGFVTDGALRDGHVLATLPFATYASSVTITTRAAFHHVADLQVPIGCAGVAIYPGDVLVGDRDGVVVVPRALAAELAGPALEQEQLEAYLHTRLKAGEALWGVYPPSEQTLAEYRAAAAAGNGGHGQNVEAPTT
jgi:regulator of RNase E activity RraA